MTEIPLGRWIDLTVDGYKGALIKSGNPPEDELIKAEADLRVQYADAIGDHEYRMYCNTVKEIAVMELTLVQIQELVNNLQNVYVPKFAAALNKLLPGSNFVFDVDKPDKYDHTLQRALNRSKHLKIAIALKKSKLLTLEQKYGNQSPGKATREYYFGVLLTLSDSAKYPVPDTITVWEFCERIKRHNRYLETVKHSNNGRG